LLKKLKDAGYVIGGWTKGAGGDSLIQRVIRDTKGVARYVIHMFQPGEDGMYVPLHFHELDAWGEEMVGSTHYYWDKVYYYIP
jgi:hypothetical protein